MPENQNPPEQFRRTRPGAQPITHQQPAVRGTSLRESSHAAIASKMFLLLNPPGYLGRISTGSSKAPMTSLSNAAGAIFTIGHSSLEVGDFLDSLSTHGVKTLCDVRSRPASFRHPQFNRELLEGALASQGRKYEFLGETLGGRPADPRFYQEDGRVDYAARRRAQDFAESITRVLSLSRTGPVALMCAEEDPLECHRFLMICPELVERGVTPSHIRRGDGIELQRDAEDRLLVLHGFEDVTSTSLFANGRTSALQDAILSQSNKFAFRASPEAIEYF